MAGRCLDEEPDDLIIVGGGASATLLVDALRRSRPRRRWRVRIFEASHSPGRGVPYRTADRTHRMNVPAIRLSVDPDDPEHLVRWLRRAGHRAEPDVYIARGLYGSYLEDVLAGAGRAAAVQVTVHQTSVTRIARRPRGLFEVATDEGERWIAPRVVLAVGAPSGPTPLPIDPRLAHGGALVTDPWAPGALGDLSRARRWIVAGTGLTMVDVALTVLRQPGASVDAVSRHGRLPRAHPVERRSAVLPLDLPAGPLTAAQVRRALVRHAAEEPAGWEASVDLFRDHSADLWPRLPADEQAKVLRRLNAWNVHRHRMSPAVARTLEDAIASGRLRIHTGRIASIARDRRALMLSVRHHGDGQSTLHGDRLVTCTGPIDDLGATDDPLLRHLLDAGLATIGPHRLGLAVDPWGTALDRSGRPVPGLTVLGALRRGTLFETTAIPELRVQATELARLLIPADLPPRLAAPRPASHGREAIRRMEVKA